VCVCVLLDLIPEYYGYSFTCDQLIITHSYLHTHTRTRTHTQAAKNGDLEGLTSVYTTCELNDRERDMVMYVACRHGQLEIVQWLVRVLKMSVQESMDGFTPLGLACRAGHLGTVQYLIEDCECIVGDVEVKSGVSTVMFGMRGNAEVRAYLMGRGIDVPPELLEEEAVAAEKKRLKEEKKKHNKDLKLKQLAKKRKAEQAALAARNSGIVAPAAPGDIMMCGPDGVKRRRSNSTLPPTPMRVTRRASMKASGSPDIKPAQAP
jgi:hypothetical protein